MDPEKEEEENEEKMEFSQGVLVALSSLERRARGRARLRRQRERGELLRARLGELRQRRDTLRDRLHQLRWERGELLRARLGELRQRRDTLRARLHQLAQGNPGIPWEPREVLLWRIRELQELLKLYPLTGVSGRLSGRGLRLSLHTSFQGCLLDSFHLELQEPAQKSREFREWRLRRHSVPPFIPLERLQRELLPRRPREFLGILLELLCAFVGRRQQLRLLQEEFSEYLQGIPSSNSLCNLLSFSCRIPGKNSQIPGKNSQIPEIPGKNPQIPGENSQNGGKNPEFSGEKTQIPGEDPEIPGKRSGFGGKNREFGGKNPGDCVELRARLRYRDPLRSLPTDVELSINGREAPGELRALLGSRSLPRALRLLLQQNSQKILEFPPGNGGNAEFPENPGILG